MPAFHRFAVLPLATLLTGIGAAGLVLAAPAGADVSPEVAGVCQAAFSGPTAAEVQLVTDPPARSDARPGQPVRLDASWVPGAWESLSSVAACVRMNRAVDPALSSSESPALDDGTYGHAFTVPDGLFNGTAICTRIRLAGDPVGEATEAVWVSKQACFEVHPEEPAGPTTSPTTFPTTSPTTAPALAPTPAAPQPAPAPVPAPTAPASSSEQAPLPRPAAPAVTDGETPGQEAAKSDLIPATQVSEREGSGLVALPLLPETGANPAGLVRTGLLAVAAGVPVLAYGHGRRRRPRRPVH